MSSARARHSSPASPYSSTVSRILNDPLARDRCPPAQPPHRLALRPPLLRQPHELCMTGGERREIEAVGLDDAAFRLAHPITLPVWRVLHRHEAELDEAAVDFLDLRRRQPEGVLLHRGRRPDDRPAALFPILRLRKAEQPVNRMDQAGRYAEPRRRRLERSEQLPRSRYANGQARKALGLAVDLEKSWCEPPEPGGPGDKPPPWRLVGAVVDIHRSPFFSAGCDGHTPLDHGNGNLR